MDATTWDVAGYGGKQLNFGIKRISRALTMAAYHLFHFVSQIDNASTSRVLASVEAKKKKKGASPYDPECRRVKRRSFRHLPCPNAL